MNEDRTGLKITLGILGILAIVAALFRVLAYEPERAVKPSVPAVTSVPPNRLSDSLEQAKRRELLGEPLDRSTAVPAGMPVQPSASRSSRHTSLPVSYPSHLASAKQAYPAKTGVPSGSKRYVDTNFYTADNKQPASYSANRNHATDPVWGGSDEIGKISSQARMQEERARMLAPYLRPNRKEKERMDAQWAKLSAAVDRAVLQALTPKSKREQNIEKYSGKNNTPEIQSSGLTGPYAPVGQAVSSQKQEMVKNFGRAFGASAAQQASAVMDNFAGELAGALNAPGATADQKAARVKDITKKYQDKMDKLAEKNQYDKFLAQRLARDNEQKAQLRAQYPNSELNEQFSQIIDAAREKDLALATQQLPAEEYYKAVYANQYEAHTQLEEAVRQAGESLQALHQWDNEQAQKQLQHLQAQEEAGQVISVARKSTPAEVAGLQNTLNRERTDLLQQVTQAYGEEKAREMKQILDNYYEKMMESSEQELSPADRQALQLKLRADSNRQMLKWQMDQVEQMNIPEDQKQSALERLRQDYNNIK